MANCVGPLSDSPDEKVAMLELTIAPSAYQELTVSGPGTAGGTLHISKEHGKPRGQLVASKFLVCPVGVRWQCLYPKHNNCGGDS